MSDLIERLRATPRFVPSGQLHLWKMVSEHDPNAMQAADALEAKDAEIARLKATIKALEDHLLLRDCFVAGLEGK